MSWLGNEVYRQHVAEGAVPTEFECRDQLTHVLGSKDFTASERQRRFLQFVVEAALAGKGDRIKAFSVATEVFGRGDDFDPQVDPIVRVEAGRLRRQLEHYYLAEGAGEPVVLEIPRGGYFPRFSYRVTADAQTEPEAGAAAESSQSSRGRLNLTAALSLILLVGLGFGLWWVLPRSGSTRAPKDGVVAPRVGPIRVMVMPFDYAADTNAHPLPNDSLTSELIVTLAALSNVEVLTLSSGKESVERRLTPPELADSLHVDYLIQGDVRQQKAQVKVTVTIVEASTSLVRSASLFEGSIEGIFDLQEEIARDIAASLAAGVTPVFERRIQTTKGLNPETLALYYEAATLRNPPSDPVRSRLGEEAYRRVIELDPEFAGGYAGLAAVLAVRSWWRVGGQPEVDARLALEAARMAVEKDPTFGWGQSTLALALNINGHEGALTTAKRAAELSAADPHALILSAMVQTFEDELEAAASLARSAIRLDPLSVRTPYRNILGIVLFQAGKYQQSIDVLQENLELGGPDGPHMAYWRAGSLAALGRTEEARSELESVSNYLSEFDIRNFLSAFRNPEGGGKLLEILRPFGLE